ncbi:MAG: PepSY-like domain-containing protein [Paludisphaera borealis]|uniref:PepSY-like domain-containing protein n=1 Tax=Paludisphaera borealis TaxID=1387353 RepID=UPI00285030B6|nr:PepSY-like domain-containing protein [Paludisphaera borealis]MDR3619108.1 PepSY-like domain-containing protein [Paludisphaera borealis]
MKILVLEAAGALFMSLAGTVIAADQGVSLDHVPGPVLAAVKAIYPAGVILDETEKDVDHDGTTYEVALMNHGKRFKVEVDSEGTLKEIEGEVAPADLPKAVADALAKQYPDRALTTAEEHVDIDQGRETKVFKVVVVAGGKTLKVKIRPDGVIEDVDD